MGVILVLPEPILEQALLLTTFDRYTAASFPRLEPIRLSALFPEFTEIDISHPIVVEELYHISLNIDRSQVVDTDFTYYFPRQRLGSVQFLKSFPPLQPTFVVKEEFLSNRESIYTFRKTYRAFDEYSEYRTLSGVIRLDRCSYQLDPPQIPTMVEGEFSNALNIPNTPLPSYKHRYRTGNYRGQFSITKPGIPPQDLIPEIDIVGIYTQPEVSVGSVSRLTRLAEVNMPVTSRLFTYGTACESENSCDYEFAAFLINDDGQDVGFFGRTDVIGQAITWQQSLLSAYGANSEVVPLTFACQNGETREYYIVVGEEILVG